MRKALVICMCLSAGSALRAQAHEVDTHGKLSVEAVRNSVLAERESRILADLGLDTAYLGIEPADPRNKRISNGMEARTVMGWIEHGSIFEDDTSTIKRPLHHFFDPVHDRPLTIVVPVGQRSPDWALEDQSDSNDQAYSLKDARGYLYRALTLPDESGRKRQFGLTFQALGHVIHHLQDMAQPEHVRNDAHLDSPQEFLGIIPNPFYDRSLYEEWTNQHRDQLVYTGYSQVAFPRAREFWTTGNERGLADFTNRNFLSQDTNFTLQADGTVALNPRYARPFSTGPSESPVPLRTLLQQDGTCPVSGGDGCEGDCAPIGLPPACVLDGDIVFHGSIVWDQYAGGGPVANPRASTLSIFDQDLADYGRPPIYFQDPDDPDSDVVEYRLLFALNRFNFQAGYPHLIPKAVAYSAGLIDHFFRGRIEVQAVSRDDAQLLIEIRNASTGQNNFSRGRYELFYDAADGTRKPLQIVEGATGDLAVNGRMVLTAVSPRQSDIDLARETPLTLVYRGQIGQDEGVAAAVLEYPVSGVIVETIVPPPDGVSGPRLIYFEDGVWKLSPYSGLAAGDVDWKGWYRNGVPTQVLTWGGARWARGETIYSNGRVLAVAPEIVRGAALTRDGVGNPWVIAIVYDNVSRSDVVYSRPARRNSSPALYHPQEAPDGWREIARYPAPENHTWGANAYWFFNGEGTEAQTMRESSVEVSLTTHDGQSSMEKVMGLDRLKYSGTATGGQIVNLGNLEGFTEETQTTYSPIEGDDGCGNSIRVGSAHTGSSVEQGQYIVGVDYLDSQEILVKNARSLTATHVSSLTATYRPSIDLAGNCTSHRIATASTTTHTVGGTETLVVSGEELSLKTPGGTTDYSCMLSEDVPTDIHGSTTFETLERFPFALDPRYSVIGYQEYRAKHAANSVTSDGRDITTTTLSMDLDTRLHAHLPEVPSEQLLAPQRLELNGTTDNPLPVITECSASPPTWGNTRRHSFGWLQMRTGSFVPNQSYSGQQGTYLVDAGNRFIVSQDNGRYSIGENYRQPLGNFNYLTSGSLPALLPQQSGEEPFYFPLGLIR